MPQDRHVDTEFLWLTVNNKCTRYEENPDFDKL